MKKLKIWLCVILSLVLAGSVIAPALAEDDTLEEGAVSTEITDVFSAELFSNAEVNHFLTAFPFFCGQLENTLGEMFSQQVLFDGDMSSGVNFRGSLTGYFNGEKDSDSLSQVLQHWGLNVYPNTLGAYLLNHQYYDVGSMLREKGNNWDAVYNGEEGKFTVDFDWGLDAISDPAQRYNAFLNIISTLIGAAKPLFNAALGTQAKSFTFDGNSGNNLLTLELKDGEIELITVNSTVEGKCENVEGNLTFGAMDLYQKVLIPLYRSLGIGTVFSYSFPALDASANAATLAQTLYDPLYALMTQVQSDPSVCRSLIAFYQSEEGASMVRGIGADLSGAYSLRCEINDLEFIGRNEMAGYLVQWDWVKNLFIGTLRSYYNYSIENPAAYFMDCQELTGMLGAQLPKLTYTEPEEPTEPETTTEPATPTEPEEPSEPETTTEPETEPPTDPTEPSTEAPDDGGTGNPLLDFLRNISEFFRKIIDWLRHLFGLA